MTSENKSKALNTYVIAFRETDKTKLAIVGGKGANLGELCRIDGIQVPDGFCITTEAYQEIIANSIVFSSLLNELAPLKADNRKGIAEISVKIRKLIEEIVIPKGIKNEITRHLKQLG
jgi:pyruvate,water dikinase